jgi:hypothetical protein
VGATPQAAGGGRRAEDGGGARTVVTTWESPAAWLLQELPVLEFKGLAVVAFEGLAVVASRGASPVSYCCSERSLRCCLLLWRHPSSALSLIKQQHAFTCAFRALPERCCAALSSCQAAAGLAGAQGPA